MRREHRLVGLMALLLVIAACGGGEGTTEEETAGSSTTVLTSTTGSIGPGTTAGDETSLVEVDACSLLTDEEVASVLGEQGEPDPWDIPPFHACTWTAPDESTVFASVTVAADAEAAEVTFVNWMTNNNYTEVTGIGDHAYTGSEITLNVLSGLYEVEVDVASEDVATAQDLASLILDRLP